MTKENKFESLLELLINEENDKAEQMFHEIVVEKSRDIYESLADSEIEEAKEESKDEEVKETEASKDEAVKETEESKDEEVKETSEESKTEETVDEEVAIEDEATESEKTEEESIEEVGGDATDELIKDISADEEGEGEKPADDMEQDMDHDGEEKPEGDVEDRVVDLEDALDELKAEFEQMMADKGGDEDKDESLEGETEVAPEIQPTEMPVEGKKADMKKEKMDEYKIQKSADTADHSDKGAKSPVNSKVKSAGGTVQNIAKGGADEKGRPAPTAQKMSDFENTGGKDKSTSFKKMEKANTADGSDKSAKSPVNAKA